MTKLYRTNDFRDEFRNEHGHVNMKALRAVRGKSFDDANDLWIDHDGKFIIPRKGDPISIEHLGLLGACCDAVTLWEREANGMTAFNEEHRQCPTEFGFTD